MKKLVASLVFTLVASNAFAAGWSQLKSVCFEAGTNFDSQQKALNNCRQFVNTFNAMATDNFVIQASCRAATYETCQYGYNVKAQLDVKVMQINQ